MRRIPIIDEIAAGKETPVCDEDMIGEIWWTGKEFQLDRQVLRVELLRGSRAKFPVEYDYVAVQVLGDSMDCAGITSGDYVLLQKANLVPIRGPSYCCVDKEGFRCHIDLDQLASTEIKNIYISIFGEGDF